jgi:hypothetical protein
MKATYEGHEIVIRIDTNYEKLFSDGKDEQFHYLPCSKNCGKLLNLNSGVISAMCCACVAAYHKGE